MAKHASARAACLLATLSGVAAADSPYCRKLHAQADEGAALLKWPTVTVEGFRLPSASSGELGPTFGDNFQARVGVSYTPSNLFRVSSLERQAELGCALHEASDSLHAQIEEAADRAVLAALRAQVAYLQGHRAEWQKLLARVDELVAARYLTAVEAHDLHRDVRALERKLAEREGEQERLEARVSAAPAASLESLAGTVVSRSRDLERESARSAAYDAFRLRFSGGVIPGFADGSVSWFGLVELSYNLGGVALGRAAVRYEQARADEIGQARSELPAQAAELRQDLRARLLKARRELQVVESDLESIRTLRATLEHTTGPSVDRVRATLAVEEIEAEADRVYLVALAEALATLADVPPAASQPARP